ncbi:MAG: hypothetical protein EOP00_34760 [Pedobacter sp.]|nr:MAG: hypothetical protein EOP00_34760 [Pedobacter sp.]
MLSEKYTGFINSRIQMHFWYVIQTKSSKIKKLVSVLSRHRLEYYLPMVTLSPSFKDNHGTEIILLLNSCVFVKLSEISVVEKVSKHGNVLYWLNKPALIPDSEILLLRNFLEKKSIIKIERVPVYMNRLLSSNKMHFDEELQSYHLTLTAIGIKLIAHLKLYSTGLDDKKPHSSMTLYKKNNFKLAQRL